MAPHFSEISDSHAWEAFVTQHAPDALFQSWYWGDVEKKRGGTVLRVGMIEGKEIRSVSQIVVVRAKRGTYLHVRHGPVFRQFSREDLQLWIGHVKERAKTMGALFVRISPRIEDTPKQNSVFKDAGCVPSPIHEVDAERCWILDLTQDEQQILSGMRKTTRYEVRRSEKLSVRVERSDTASDLDTFLNLYSSTSKRHGFVAHGSIREEYEIFSSKGMANLYLGYDGTNLISGALILYYAGRAIYHHGASVQSKIPVSYAVQWRAIIDAKKAGMTVYNFYGIAPDDKPDHPWNGLTLFKKGFGGSEQRFVHSRDIKTSPLYVFPAAIEAFRTRSRGY